MGMLEKAFGSFEVGKGKGKAGEEVFRGAEAVRRTAGEKELELGDVPGRSLDATRAESVYSGYTSGVEAAIMQHQMDKKKPRISDKELIEKQTKLRDDITFLKSELQRYVGIMSQARSNNEVSAVKDMMDAIKLAEDKKAKLEAELESLAG